MMRSRLTCSRVRSGPSRVILISNGGQCSPRCTWCDMARPLAREHRFGLVRSETGHVLHLDAVARRGLQHALASVRQHHGAQHAVALDELLPGALEPVAVEGAACNSR